MAIQETTGGNRQDDGDSRVPRWLLLLVTVLAAAVLAQWAGILTAASGSSGVQAVTVGFLVFGGGVPAILKIIAFLGDRD
ncbi:hypothetical protein [Cryptosporangium japonicum]|uniref:Uncharacterized protein n=1 Tax=Cryptosporangium japonicum TaxID=80872 RepID=A0ABP3ETB9_9ACTN